MTHPNDPEEVLHGDAAPRQVGPREGNDPSNTPVEELVEDIDPDDPTLQQLSQLWANPADEASQ